MNIDNKQLEREIENAIRARGLKEQMLQWDKEAKGERREVKGNEASEQKITPWRKIRRTIYSLSAIAAVAAILIVAIPPSTWNSTYHQLSRWGYRQYAHFFLKQQPKQPVVYEHTITELMAMADPSVVEIMDGRHELQILGHEDLILDAAWQIRKGKYAMAQSILTDALDTLSEDDAYYQDAMDDIQYLSALCQLGLNKRSKALKELSKIAESNSRHSVAAAEIAKAIK